jgi:hypothetical protein
MGFLKPHVEFPSILDTKPKNPLGYVTKDGLWAAVPYGKKFIIIHNGKQDVVCNTYKQSLDYIKKQSKIKTTSSLEEFL